jgi:hypothetical protein
MGLLDEAIREHLELKRRRGADPGEVAREQREALDPVPRGGSEAQDEGLEPGDGAALADPPVEADGAIASGPEHVEVEHVEADSADADHEDADGHVGASSPANAEETAELDMRSVLGADDDADRAQPPGAEGLAGAGEGGSKGPLTEEESLEWEVPSASGEHAAEDQNVEEQDSAEDVLEETPDFLRDTPEQERLWFEQRPPRDFDFDK